MTTSIATQNYISTIYIPFVGIQYTADNIRNVFANYQIGSIRSIIFLDHNYISGTPILGSREEVWGRPAIIEIGVWEANEFTRALHCAMNMGLKSSSLMFNGPGPGAEFWLIQKYRHDNEEYAIIADDTNMNNILFAEINNNSIME